MSSNFPPCTTHLSEVEAVVEFLACMLEGRQGIYISAPITSGKRLLKWHRQRVGDAIGINQHVALQDIVNFNRRRAQKRVRKLREILAKPLMDPTVVADLPGWSQDDYRYLWATVIKRHVNTVISINDWNYSNGCAYEFLIAKQGGLVTFNEDLQPISTICGMKLIKQAIADLSSNNIEAAFLMCVYDELHKLEHPVEEVCAI